MPAKPSRDARVNTYLAKAKPFAQPILTELRARVHAAVPGLTEDIKWRVPFFLLDGRIFVSMAAFKAHTKMIIWNADFKMATKCDFASVKDLPTKAALAKLLKANAKGFTK